VSFGISNPSTAQVSPAQHFPSLSRHRTLESDKSGIPSARAKGKGKAQDTVCHSLSPVTEYISKLISCSRHRLLAPATPPLLKSRLCSVLPLYHQFQNLSVPMNQVIWPQCLPSKYLWLWTNWAPPPVPTRPRVLHRRTSLQERLSRDERCRMTTPFIQQKSGNTGIKKGCWRVNEQRYGFLVC
jgi:hypothetical protein